MSVQIAGFTSANIAEVETNTKALRITPKPLDWGSLGIYAIGGVSGVMAAGLAAAANIVSFRWTTTNVCAVKKIVFSAGDTATAFAAGVLTFNAFIARSFTVSDSTGTAATLSGNNQRLRTTMGATTLGDLRWSATAALTAGTRTLDAQPFASVTTSVPATAGNVLFPIPVELFRANAGDYPLLLAQNEGFVIQATVPATGTWTFSVNIIWEELTAYVP